MAAIRPKGYTKEQWAILNTVLKVREIGVETDTLALKIGDGVTPWNQLKYAVQNNRIETIDNLNPAENQYFETASNNVFVKKVAYDSAKIKMLWSSGETHKSITNRSTQKIIVQTVAAQNQSPFNAKIGAIYVYPMETIDFDLCGFNFTDAIISFKRYYTTPDNAHIVNSSPLTLEYLRQYFPALNIAPGYKVYAPNIAGGTVYILGKRIITGDANNYWTDESIWYSQPMTIVN